MMLTVLENLHGCVEVFLCNRTMLPRAECLTDFVVCKAVVDGVRDRLSREYNRAKMKVYGQINETKKCIREYIGRSGPM